MKLVNVLIFTLLVSFAAKASGQELVVVASAQSKISTLSKYEVIGIYMGRYRTSESEIKVLPLDNKADKELFYSVLINKSLTSVNSYWARLKFTGRDYQRPLQVETTEQVIINLHNDHSAIAYLPKHLVTSELKVVYELSK